MAALSKNKTENIALTFSKRGTFDVNTSGHQPKIYLSLNPHSTHEWCNSKNSSETTLKRNHQLQHMPGPSSPVADSTIQDLMRTQNLRSAGYYALSGLTLKTLLINLQLAHAQHQPSTKMDVCSYRVDRNLTKSKNVTSQICQDRLGLSQINHGWSYGLCRVSTSPFTLT